MSEEVLTSLGCDYITATADTQEGVRRLHSLASAIFRSERDFGNEAKAWGLAGFTGFKAGGIQIGKRDNALIVRLSSDTAMRSWSSIMDHAENVSRIDLQATVQIPDDVQRRIDRYRAQARRDAVKSGNRRKVRWVQEHHGGYTLYCGTRQSNVFGRIYDKHAESGMDQHRSCVRFEAQYQHDLAWFVARELKGKSSPMMSMASYLTQFFTGRGVKLDLPFKDRATYCCSRPRSDHDKNLAWLQAAVRPCVQRLIDAGRGDDVFRALGLIVDDDA